MTNNRPYQHLLERERQRRIAIEILKAIAGIVVIAAIAVLLMVIFW